MHRASANRFLNFCTTAATWIEESNGDLDILRETYKWEDMSLELRNYCEHVAKTISEEGQSQIDSSAVESDESAEETIRIWSSPSKGKGREVPIAAPSTLEDSEAESGAEDVIRQAIAVEDTLESDESEKEDESQEAREALEVERILSAPPSDGMLGQDLETDEGRLERDLDDEGIVGDQHGVDGDSADEDEGEEGLEEEFFAGVGGAGESAQEEEDEEEEGDAEGEEFSERDVTLMPKDEVR